MIFSTEILLSKTDPAEWKLEVERVSSLLKLPKNLTDQKDWRNNFEKMRLHHKQIGEHLDETKAKLTKMTTEISGTLEKIETRENILNEQFGNLVEEYRQ